MGLLQLNAFKEFDELSSLRDEEVDRDGSPRFYDINGLSNFVAKPLEVLGWDPHERLVDYLVKRIEEAR